MFGFFSSHGFSNTGGDAGYASDVEQLQSASQRQDQTNAVERHVRHSCEMEEVRTFFFNQLKHPFELK